MSKPLFSPEVFEKYKVDFYNLTNKNADDNLDAFFSYLTLIGIMDVKDRLKQISAKLDNCTNSQ